MDHNSATAASRPCTAFTGTRLLSAGALTDVALAVKAATRASADAILVFDDATGRVIDLDLRGSKSEIAARLPKFLGDVTPPITPDDASTASASGADKRGRGRPKLGVVPREVTLLPRHWDWLGAQPGGASVTLRRLVDEARRAGAASEQLRQAREVAYRFMSAMAGNLPGFEEATRALFAGDAARYASLIAAWPDAIAAYTARLAAGAFAAAPPAANR
jgi:hypothetical protein